MRTTRIWVESLRSRARWLLPLTLLALCLGCGGGAAPNAALEPWPATVAAAQAPQGGPPAPPALPRLDPQTRARTASPDGEANATVPVGAGWNLVSLPVSEVSSTRVGPGIFPTAFSWDPQAGAYVRVGLDDPASLNAGAGTRRGFWVYASQASELQVGGRANSGSGPDAVVDLHPGWNLLGVPYAEPRSLGQVQVRVPGGQTLFLAGAVSPQIPAPTPETLLYGYGFLYGGSTYESLGLNNPGNSLEVGRALWVYVHQAGTRLWYQVPTEPEGDTTISGTLAGGGSLVALDPSGAMFTSEIQMTPNPGSLGQPSAAGDVVLVLKVPSGRTYRFYLLRDGGMYPLYEGEFNRFTFQGPVTLDLGRLEAVEGRAVAQNAPSGTGGVVPDGADPTSPSLESPLLVGQPLQGLVESGLRALSDQSWLLARAYFGAAARAAGDTVSQDADAARFFHALTRVAALGQELASDGLADGYDDLGDFLDAAGFSPVLRSSLKDLRRPQVLPPGAPTGEDARRFLATRVRRELEGALQDLARVSPSFQRTWNLPHPGTGGLPSQVESDYGDVLFFQAGYRAVLASTLVAASYDLGGSVTDPLNAGTLTWESALAAFPQVLTHKDLALLPVARTALESFPGDMQAAIARILAETDPQGDDLIGIPDAGEANAFSQKLDTWREALNQPTTLRDPGGNTATLDLTRFFDADGLALRPFLFPYKGNEIAGSFQGSPFGDVYTGYTAGSLPDPNRDRDEDGRPDAVVPPGKAPTLVARWANVAPEGQRILASNHSPDGSHLYFLCGDDGNLAARTLVITSPDGVPQDSWSVSTPLVSADGRWSFFMGVGDSGVLTMVGQFEGAGVDLGFNRKIVRRYSPGGTLLAQGELASPVPGLRGLQVRSAHPGVVLDSDGKAWTWTEASEIPTTFFDLAGLVAACGNRGYTLAVKGTGEVWAWGQNGSGQLGDGTRTERKLPVQVQGLSGAVTVATGTNHSLALTSDGTVWAWGGNGDGQLGDGTQTGSRTARQVPGVTGVVAIAAAEGRSFALREDGTVLAWGREILDQNPGLSFRQVLSPTPVPGLSGVVALEAADSHCLARKGDGTVWAWGGNAYGQLGDGTTTTRTTPVPCEGLAGVVDVAAGPGFSLALGSDGTGWAWGRNTAGALAPGSPAGNLPWPTAGAFSAPGGELSGAGLGPVLRTSDGIVWPVGPAPSSSLPRGSALFPDGNFLCPVGNHLELFNTSNLFVEDLGSPGGAPGQFRSPRGIDVAPDGTIYVADAGNARVQRFGADGTFLGEFPTPGVGIDVDHTGRPYLRFGNKAARYAADGRLLCVWFVAPNATALETLPGHVAVFGEGRDVLKFAFPYAP